MKTSVLKKNLIQGLNIVERITGKNLTLPVLNNVLIKTEKNFLNLTTTNLEIAIQCWILAKIEKEGIITIPAKLLTQFISFLPDEKLNLEIKNQILHITSKNYKSQIKGLSDEEFPIIPKIETKDFIDINLGPFIEGISQVVNFTTMTQTRPELAGLYFNFQKNNARVAATDSFRLAEKNFSFEKPNIVNKEIVFILPQRAAQELINICAEEGGKVRIYFTPTQVLFEYLIQDVSYPKIQLVSRLIEGEYPNYQEIIPKNSETKIVLPKNEFINQIKTASLFSGKTNEIQIRTNLSKKEVEFFAQNPDLGENKSTLTAKIEGKDTKISFNHRFLLDGILNIKSQEIIFELNGPDKAAVLKPVGDASYIYVVMPIMPAEGA